jgi:ATP-binding cassette subfamily B protein
MRTDYGYFEEKKLGKTYDFRLLKRLIPFARPIGGMLVWSILLVILITVLDLSVPYLTKVAVDEYIVPRAEFEADISAGSDASTKRFVAADLSDSRQKEIVERHPALFEVTGDSARISLADLVRLSPEEISVLRRPDLSGIGRVTVLFLGIILLSFGFNFAQRVVMEYAGHLIMHRLRTALFAHLQSLSIEYFSHNPVGRLVTRVTNDVQNMHELFTSLISFVFKDLFLLIGIAVVLTVMNPQLALTTFAIIPFVVAAAVIFSKRAREVFRTLRIKVAEINTHFAETIGGMKVIQLFRNEEINHRRFEALNHDNYLAGMRQIRILGTFLPAIEVLGVTAVAVVIFFGGSDVLKGDMTLGALVAFIAYMKMFFRPIRDLAEKYNILQNAMASAERIFLVLDSDSRLPSVPALPQSIDRTLDKVKDIGFERVFFSYIPGETVLENIDFRVRAGDTVGIVGPTGSGKTSLINLLLRFYDPTSGRILINGKDLREIPADRFRSKMAMVMQDPFLFSESIRKNILRGNGRASDANLDEILTLSNCKVLTDKLPDGVDTILSESGASISSGERQLISIARAFARNPEIILFDEATSYVDSQTEVQIQQALKNLMAGRTSIIVAHRLSTVRHADKILVLHLGRIIESGNHDELMARQGFYYRLNQLQV